MTMKKLIISTLSCASLAVLLSGCSLLGLDLQEKYDYKYDLQYDNQLEINGWEFIQLHAEGNFENFIAAVEYAGIDPEIFNQPGITIFPLRNGGIKSTRGTGNNGNPGGYWNQHPIQTEAGVMVPAAWTDYGTDNAAMKEQVKQFVLNHIVTMPISFGEFLKMVPDGRCTFFPSMATNGYGYVSLHMLNFVEAPEAGTKITQLWVNDFPSHFTKSNPTATATWDQRHFTPRTSNLRTKNGSYIHIMDNTYLDFPIDSDLEAVPIWNGKK